MADEEDASLLEDAMDRLVGKGIIVDQSQCWPGFGHTEQAPKARCFQADGQPGDTSQQEDSCPN